MQNLPVAERIRYRLFVLLNALGTGLNVLNAIRPAPSPTR